MEIWKDIKGYEGYYQVSNMGRVKGLTRTIKHLRGFRVIKEHILPTHVYYSSKNYKREQVSLSKKGIHKTHRVHRLVANAFIPNNKHKKYINHIDSNTLNNNVNNLEWVTHKENMQHAFEYGTIRGLTKKDIPIVIDKYLKSVTTKQLAKEFNVTTTTILNTLHRNNITIRNKRATLIGCSFFYAVALFHI